MVYEKGQVTSDDQDHTDIDEIALSKSGNLVSIHADIWNRQGNHDLRVPALMRTITLALNLKHVEIFLRKGRAGRS